MRSLTLTLGTALTLGLLACCSSAPACPVCPSGQACDPKTRTCVPGLEPGQPCGLDGGATAGEACVSGAVCSTFTDGTSVCAVTCNLDGSAPFCPGAELCGSFAAPDGGRQGLCLTAAALGGSCNPDGLIECTPPGVCVQPPASATGTCFALCDPTSSANPCTGGESCLAAFSAADAGVCATPVADGGPCSDYANAFCPRGELCIQEAGTDAGSCFARCDPAAAACAGTQSCLAPLGPGQATFCATPQPTGSPCSTATGQFCSDADRCITKTAGSDVGVCYQSCGSSQPCPAGTTCNPTTDPTVSYCL